MVNISPDRDIVDVTFARQFTLRMRPFGEQERDQNQALGHVAAMGVFRWHRREPPRFKGTERLIGKWGVGAVELPGRVGRAQHSRGIGEM
jgi:hypothetical protein